MNPGTLHEDEFLLELIRLREDDPSARVTGHDVLASLGREEEDAGALVAKLKQAGFVAFPSVRTGRLGEGTATSPLTVTATGEAYAQQTSIPHPRSTEPELSESESPISTWESVERPFLIAARRAEISRGRIDLNDFAREAGISFSEATQTFLSLRESGYVDAHRSANGVLLNFKLGERARREIGQWPSTEQAFERMMAALEHLAENAPDPDTRTRARKIFDAFTSGTKDLGIQVAAAVIAAQTTGR